MSLLSKEALAESEIILNKTNIALARSRKLIQSWLSESRTTDQQQEEEDDDEDFKPDSETAGIGSTANEDDNGALSRARTRHNNDKLLEQILGKKAASTHKKSRDAASRAIQPNNDTFIKAKAATASVSHKHSLSDDEDEGRTSAVGQKSRKLNGHAPSVTHRLGEATERSVSPDAMLSAQTTEPQGSKQPPSRRKANSYLDELLAKRSKKKVK